MGIEGKNLSYNIIKLVFLFVLHLYFKNGSGLLVQNKKTVKPQFQYYFGKIATVPDQKPQKKKDLRQPKWFNSKLPFKKGSLLLNHYYSEKLSLPNKYLPLKPNCETALE